MNNRRHHRLALALAAALAPGLGAADVTLTQSVSVDAGGTLAMFGTRGTLTTMISGDKARSESRMEASSGMMARLAGDMDSTTIVRLDRQVMINLMPEEKEYSEVTFAQLQAQMEQSLAQLEDMQGGGVPVSDDDCQWSEPVIEVDKTGESARFAGVKAAQTLVTASQTCTVPDSGQSCDLRWTLDYWLARRMPGDDEAQAYAEGMARAMGGDDALAMVQMQARGLMAMFKKGWDEVLDETGDLKGYPVKTVMRLDIGGDDCTTASGQPIAMDDMWADAADAATMAAGQTAAGHAGSAVAREAAEAAGGGVGGSIAGSAVGAASREIASGFFNKFRKKREEDKQERAAEAQAQAEAAGGMVALFTIATELTDVDDGRITADRFEVPAGWRKVDAPGY